VIGREAERKEATKKNKMVMDSIKIGRREIG
jgi:hypothetical protein